MSRINVYEEYIKKLDKLYDNLEEYTVGTHANGDEWKFVEEKDGTKIFKHKKHKNILIKGYTKVHCSCDKIIQHLSNLNFEVRKQWDTQCIEMREVLRFTSGSNNASNKFGEYKVLGYTKFGSPTTLFSERDFFFLGDVKKKNDLVMMNTISIVDDERCPPIHGVVRGDLSIVGWVIRPCKNPQREAPARVEPGSATEFCGNLVDASEAQCCEVWYVSQVDLKGWIPAWLSNYTAMMMVSCLPKIRDVLESMYRPNNNNNNNNSNKNKQSSSSSSSSSSPRASAATATTTTTATAGH